MRSVHALLVEDDDGHAELVELGFVHQQSSRTLDRVTDGVAALQHLRRESGYANRPRADVVILDLKLPGTDGHEVLAEIRRDARLHDLAVVILTTSEVAADRAEANLNRADRYLVKPEGFTSIGPVVDELIRGR